MERSTPQIKTQMDGIPANTQYAQYAEDTRKALAVIQARLPKERHQLMLLHNDLLPLLATEDTIRAADAAEMMLAIAPPSDAQINWLRAQLKDNNPNIRYTAASAFGYLGKAGKSAAPDLLERAQIDPESKVRSASLYALAKVEPSNPEALKIIEAKTRQSAPLIQPGDSDAVKRQKAQAIMERMEAADQMRFAAAAPNNPQADAAITTMMKSDDPAVRSMAMGAVGDKKENASPEHVKQLIAALDAPKKGEYDFSASNAAVALKKINTPEAQQALAKWQAKQNAKDAEGFLALLRDTRPCTVTERYGLPDGVVKNPGCIRKQYLYSWGGHPLNHDKVLPEYFKQLIPELTKLTESPDYDLAEPAAVLLARCGDPAAKATSERFFASRLVPSDVAAADRAEAERTLAMKTANPGNQNFSQFTYNLSPPRLLKLCDGLRGRVDEGESRCKYLKEGHHW